MPNIKADAFSFSLFTIVSTSTLIMKATEFSQRSWPLYLYGGGDSALIAGIGPCNESPMMEMSSACVSMEMQRVVNL